MRTAKSKIINAGKYNHKITIYKIVHGKDKDGFPADVEEIVLTPYANVKTTKGMTLIRNGSNFEEAYTNFTIRYSQTVVSAYYDSENSNRDMLISFKGKTYQAKYLNNIDEADIELEIQAREVLK